MSINCCGCGRFIAFRNLQKCRNYFEPDSDRGSEISEWTCQECLKKDAVENESISQIR